MDRSNLPIIIYDVDGVILDYNIEFMRWYHSHTPILRRHNCIKYNPKTWEMGFVDGMDKSILDDLINEFHSVHSGEFPLIDECIPGIISELWETHRIIIISSYPNESTRINNLVLYNIKFDEVKCDISNKTTFIQENYNIEDVSAIFEDGPHHIDEMVNIFPGKIHSPRMWDYVYDRYHSDARVKLYNSPYDWLKLLEG